MRFRGVLFLSLLFYFPLQIEAQETKIIRGKITQLSNLPLESVSVLLVQASDSTLVKSAVSGKQGEFEFSNLKAAKYTVITTHIGFNKKRSGPYDLTKKSILDISIQLTPLNQGLAAVTVTEKKPFLEIKPGKVIVNVNNSVISSGNNALEILKRAPGVQINQDNIYLRGKNTALVMIDGHTVYFDSENLSNLLQNIQSSSIERIELISNPQSMYDSGGPAGIINIQLKKGHSVGFNGSISSGAGYGDDYKLNSGLDLNYRKGRFNIFGIYSYNNNKQPQTTALNRSVIYKSLLTQFDIDNIDNKLRDNNNYKLGFDYYLDKNNTVGIQYTGLYNSFKSVEENQSIISNNSVFDSLIHTNSFEKRRIASNAFNLNYNGKMFNNKGEIHLDVDYLKYNRHSKESLDYQYFNRENTLLRPAEYIEYTSPAAFDIRSAKLDYSYNLSTHSDLDIGFKSSSVKSDNDRDFRQLENGSLRLNASLSNRFLFQENIHSAYLNYSLDYEKNSLELGLRAEKTITKGESLAGVAHLSRNYTGLFPNLQWTTTVNKNNKVLFSYSRRIGRPAYEDLNPFLYFLDKYTYREGNPYLKPEYSNKFEISHLYKQKYATTLRYTSVKDASYIIMEQNDSLKVTRNIKRNFDRQYTFSLEFNTPLKFTSWWTGNLNIEGLYSYFNYNNTEGYENQRPYLNLITSHSFLLPHNLSAELSFDYESKNAYSIYTFKPTYILDAGMGKLFLDKKLSLKLSLSDLFNSDRFNYYTSRDNLNIKAIEKAESRIFRMNITYRFGKEIDKNSSRRRTGNEEERRRMQN
ncbi:TonB-dependent receptor domain-containing protein [Rubrolithibacter danxiaensis]|uniref:TonB-dependent receptor domain-containing protein n=1 Tax=Rubrolithibacter danxiaensis TaxID=3390805 RepID=UPI003BF84653